MTEIDLTPITRLEYDIDAILNDHAVAEPITRIELILSDIVAGNTTTVEPVTRIETYLAIISGANYPVPEPVTRIETFLAIIAGEDYETPEAVTRLEGLLAEWVEKGSGIWKTVTGTLIHLTDALASPMQKCEVSLEPIQAGSGDPSPDNIRPITGWTGCEVNVTNENLFDEVWELGGISNSTGNNVPSNNSLRCKNYVAIPNGNTFRVSWTSQSAYILFTAYDKNKIFTRYLGALSSSGTGYSLNSNEYYIRFYNYNNTTPLSDFCISLGENVKPYSPHQGTTLSVTFPDTVYGGSHELVEGLLKIPKKCFIFDGTEEWYRWQACDGGSWFVLYFKDSDHAASIDYRKNISSHFKSINSNSITTSSPTFEFGVSKTWLACSAPYNTADEFKAYLAAQYNANTPVQIFYELAEPLTYQLTPQEISTLAGENNVWSNSNGDTTIIYKAQSS